MLSIAIEELNSPGILAAKLWIKEGSRADPPKMKGCHQILGSTLSRGCGPYDNIQIADIVEGCGAALRCETYEDGLLISLKCIDDDIYKLLPILGWMIKKPHLDNKQINLEKSLTIQAIHRQRENPFHIAFDSWRQIAYKHGEYSHDPLGTDEDLKRITKEEISKMANSLLSRNKILFLAGSIPKDIKDQIREIEPFNELLKHNKNKIELSQYLKSTDFKKLTKNNLCVNHIKTEQVVILLGKPSIPHGHSDALGLRLLACHLGSGMSSVLFKVLREQYGVVYEVGLYHPVRELNAPFIFHASTQETKASTTLSLMRECWDKTLEIPLTENELLLAKSKFKGQLALSLQSVGQKAERKAHLIGIGLDQNHDITSIDNINKLTGLELLRIAQVHLRDPLLSLCGPKQKITELTTRWNC